MRTTSAARLKTPLTSISKRRRERQRSDEDAAAGLVDRRRIGGDLSADGQHGTTLLAGNRKHTRAPRRERSL
jgi:hypothetical protein